MYRSKLSLLVIIILLLIVIQVPAQESRQKLYRIHINNEEEIKTLSQKGFDIYNISPGKFIEVLAYPDKIESITTQDLKIEFIANSFKELLERELGDALSEYHDYQTMFEDLKHVSEAYPHITKLDTIGYSIEGRAIGVLKVSDNPGFDEDEPPILIVGCHHGNEILNIEVVLFFIHYLMENYGTDPEITNWVNNLEIWFIPLLNPDGREKLTRGNSNGIDLNRNYSFQFTPGGSHGPTPFSEPETRAMRDFTQIYPPILSLTYHSSGRLVLYSWTHTDKTAPDNDILIQIGGTVADSLNYTLRQGGRWYFTEGEYCDYMYGVHGTMAFTIETYNSQMPHPSVIDGVTARNLPGFIALLKQVDRSGMTGFFSDAKTNNPVVAAIDVLEIDDQGLLFPRVSDKTFGRYYRYLVPGNYRINISAPGYETRFFDTIPISLDSLTHLSASLNPYAHLVVTDFYLDDDSVGITLGNGDGIIQTTEKIGLAFTLENQTDVPSKGVYAKLTSSSQHVEILIDSVYIGDLNANSSFTPNGKFLFSAIPSYPDGKIADLIITITDSSRTEWYHELSFEVHAPHLKFNYVKVHDDDGDRNGILNNGETARIEVNIKNLGRQAVADVIGTLYTYDSFTRFKKETDHVNHLGNQQDSSFFFELMLAPGTPQFHLIDFSIALQSEAGHVAEAFFQLNNVRGFFDNFDYQNNDWVHSSWKTTSNHHDDWQWDSPQGKGGDPSKAYSGKNCWGTDLGFDDFQGTSWNGNYQDNVHNFLESPPFSCTGLTNVELRFLRWLSILPEDVARINVNGNVAWISPVEGIKDSKWGVQIVDISPWADNQNQVKIQFELESNDSESAGGWNIDNVFVTGDAATGVANDQNLSPVQAIELFQNYPNPFNPATKIVYTVPARQHVELKIIDILGREVKTIFQGDREAGMHQTIWDGSDRHGNPVASGVYFYQLKISRVIITKRLLLTK